MARLLIGLLVAAAAWGQVTLVTISDTLRTPTGGLFNGTLGIALRYAGPLSSGSNTLTAAYQRVSVINGVLNITLVPNDSISPGGTSYSVRYSASNGMTWEETWVVPSSPSTTTVRAIRSTTTPSPTVTFSPQQISTAGAANGQALVFNGSSVGWAYVTGTGGVWGAITGTLSAQTDLWSALSGKAAVSHTHTASDIASGTLAAARLGSGTASSSTFLRGDSSWASVGWADISGKPSTFTPSTHSHPPSEVTSGGATTGQVLKWSGTEWVPAADNTGGSPAWGTITGTLSAQTDLQSALDAKISAPSLANAASKYLRRNSANTAWELSLIDWSEIQNKPSTFSPSSHSHPISDVTNLQTTLDGKAPTSHTHTLGQLQQSGATTGQVPQWNGTAWIPTTLSGGGTSQWQDTTGGIYYSSGNVGIGTSSPAQPLDISTSASYVGAVVRDTTSGNAVAALLRSNTNAGELQLYSGGTASTVLRPIGTSVIGGSLGIGKTPTVALDVNGTVAATALQGSLDWSYVTNTPSTYPPSTHSHAGSDITSGTVAAARLGSGTADGSTFLRGDSTWALPPVTSVFGRTGAVTAASGDYAATQITNTPAGNIVATTVQAAINELDTEKAAASHQHSLGDLTQSGASTGQFVQWNGAAWVPANLPSTANYSQSFTGQTSVSLTHNAGTTDVLVSCYNGSGVEIIPQSITLTDANTVTVAFGSATTGKCVVNRASGGGGGSGTVTSVGLSMPSGFTVTGSPVTSSGTLAVTTSLSGVVRATGGGFTVVSGNASDCVKVDGTSGACGSGGSVYTGTGLTGDGSAGNPVRVDPSGAVASQAYYSAALDFGAIAAASCAELNITASGVTAGAAIAPAWPASLPAGVMGMMYGGTNLIVVRLCNVTGAAVDPASATFGARVIGGF